MKLNEFRTLEYSAPSCKVVKITSHQQILTGSYDDVNHTEKYDIDPDEDL